MISETILHQRILHQFGAGGTGEVYLAQDARLGRKVARSSCCLQNSLRTETGCATVFMTPERYQRIEFGLGPNVALMLRENGPRHQRGRCPGIAGGVQLA